MNKTKIVLLTLIVLVFAAIIYQNARFNTRFAMSAEAQTRLKDFLNGQAARTSTPNAPKIESLTLSGVEPIKTLPGIFSVALVAKFDSGDNAPILLAMNHDGTKIFNSVSDVTSGTDEMELIRIKAMLSSAPPQNVPDGLGVRIIEGKGKHRLVIVSDFFCGFCGLAEEWAHQNAARMDLAAVDIIPIGLSPMGERLAMHVLNDPTSYARCKAFAVENKSTAGQDIMPKLEDAFPPVIPSKERMTTWRQFQDNAGIKETPRFIVDGILLPRGVSLKALEFILLPEGA